MLLINCKWCIKEEIVFITSNTVTQKETFLVTTPQTKKKFESLYFYVMLKLIQVIYKTERQESLYSDVMLKLIQTIL